MLKNACLLAKIGADTAENERLLAENLPKIGNYSTGPAAGRRPKLQVVRRRQKCSVTHTSYSKINIFRIHLVEILRYAPNGEKR